MNPQTEKLFGYTRDELLGQPVEVLVPARCRGLLPAHRLDPAGRVVTWNASAIRLTGYQAEAMPGQHFSRFYEAGDIQQGKPVHALSVAVATGYLEDEGWRLRTDGSRS